MCQAVLLNEVDTQLYLILVSLVKVLVELLGFDNAINTDLIYGPLVVEVVSFMTTDVLIHVLLGMHRWM